MKRIDGEALAQRAWELAQAWAREAERESGEAMQLIAHGWPGPKLAGRSRRASDRALALREASVTLARLVEEFVPPPTVTVAVPIFGAVDVQLHIIGVTKEIQVETVDRAIAALQATRAEL